MAMKAGRREEGGEKLMHAQEIVLELRATLDGDAWAGAAGLAQIYEFVVNELIAANIKADVARIVACRSLIEPLLDAWRQAALATADNPRA
jgi:flagellar protein FliS